ncbi:MAG: histidine--tRNA ligase [Firmicutes bacterium]|nr:histidine--tRNA ligase [Bacillota bacterium]
MFSSPRGTADILPEEAREWQWMEGIARDLCARYGYGEIRTPLFEHTELFHRGVGNATDIVEKEMYTFVDRSGRSLTLRPEGTAPVGRAYLEHHLNALAQPVKLYYVGSMFRYERPQAGRMREFHQFGVEVFGSASPLADVEVITLAHSFYEALGSRDTLIALNSIGCPQCRPRYLEALQEYYRPKIGGFCANCQRRLERNPLRLLDCKEEQCRRLSQDVPPIYDYLCSGCRAHFQQVQELLAASGLAFQLQPRLVRGLDYYTRTVFEFIHSALGAQDALGGGGRYDGLIEDLGGPPVPGVGFAMGLDRLLVVLRQSGRPGKAETDPQVCVLAFSGLEKEGFLLARQLRAAGLRVLQDFGERGLKAQMKWAGRTGAPWAVLLGPDEWQQQKVILRDLTAGGQEEVAREQIVPELCRRLGSAAGER